MDNKETVLQCKDCFGSAVVFYKEDYDKHEKKHSELRLKSFCPERIMTALETPTFTIEGNIKNTVCYYLEEFSINGIIRYTKVIVNDKYRKSKNFCNIKTAFRPTNVKELKYGLKPLYY